MKKEQRSYERLIYNHETGSVDVYRVPMPETTPDSRKWKNLLPIVALIGVIGCRVMGVM